MTVPLSAPSTASAQSPGDAASIQTIKKLQAALNSSATPLAQRYRALFGLKHHACRAPASQATSLAIDAIASAFATPSALLKHEVAYCLGQTRNAATLPHLDAVLRDRNEDPMVRHEAAEAIGAVGASEGLESLRERRDDSSEETVVRETCEIAVARIEWLVGEAHSNEGPQASAFSSIDPAPSLPAGPTGDLSALRSVLLDASLPLFRRYRAMFALRDLASPPTAATAVPAIESLALGLKDPSALFRHEIAFVFGQLSHPAAIPALVETLKDRREVPMVRHEAAEALGGLGEDEAVGKVLQQFLQDEEQIVRESIEVALDMAEFEKSGQLEYAVIPQGDTAPAASLVEGQALS